MSAILVEIAGERQPLLFAGATARHASERHIWTGFALEEYQVPAGGEFPPGLVFCDHTFTAFLGDTRTKASLREGRREWSELIVAGDMCVRSQQEFGSYRWDRSAELAVLAVPQTTIAESFPDMRAAWACEFVPGMIGDDPVLRGLLSALIAELSADCPAGGLFGESVVTALLAHALRAHAADPVRIGGGRSGLAAHALRRVTEYIHAHLDQPLHVDVLARIVGLGGYHFGKQFKRSTGMTVHQYVLGLRLRRAERLLRRTDARLAEVALRAGFANQSHFTQLFRSRFGVTPGEFRRLAR